MFRYGVIMHISLSKQSPAAIAAELGARLKQARLNIDLTQEQVGQKAGLTRKAVIKAEKGDAKLDVLVAILQALGLTEQLDRFIPEQSISPLQLAKLSGKQRQRSSGKARSKQKGSEQW